MLLRTFPALRHLPSTKAKQSKHVLLRGIGQPLQSCKAVLSSLHCSSFSSPFSQISGPVSAVACCNDIGLLALKKAAGGLHHAAASEQQCAHATEGTFDQFSHNLHRNFCKRRAWQLNARKVIGHSEKPRPQPSLRGYVRHYKAIGCSEHATPEINNRFKNRWCKATRIT